MLLPTTCSGTKTLFYDITWYWLFSYYYYCYTHLTAFFQDNLGKPATERQTILNFTGARDDWVAVASAGPYANHLHLAPDR